MNGPGSDQVDYYVTAEIRFRVKAPTENEAKGRAALALAMVSDHMEHPIHGAGGIEFVGSEIVCITEE